MQLLELGLVFGDVRANFRGAFGGLRQVSKLALAQLLRVLDGLFDTGDLGAHLVVRALHFVEVLGALGVLFARLLDLALHPALLGDRRLQGILGSRKIALVPLGLLIEYAQAHGQQLRRCLPLLGLVLLVTLCRLCLAVEMANLFVDFVNKVCEPLEVLARVADAVFGLAPALLVLGDAGRLFDVHAHFLGLGLDDARDHALLDDRVAARPEAGTEENAGDVFATAFRAVQEVARDAVARDGAPNGDLREVGVLATDGTVRVIEDQFDRRGADRLSGAGAVEDDIRHRVAAQPRRR